jgi:exosortase E/protease (VPEID-CTERM system)
MDCLLHTCGAQFSAVHARETRSIGDRRPNPILLLVFCCFVIELFVFTIWRSSRLSNSGLLGYAIIDAGWKSEILRAALAFLLVFFPMAFSALGDKIHAAAVLKRTISIRWLAVHSAALLGSVVLLSILTHSGSSLAPHFVTVLRLILLSTAAFSAALSLISAPALLAVLKNLGWQPWTSAGVVATLINPITHCLWSVASPVSGATFWLVQKLLGILVRDVISYPGERVIGTEAFSVRIAPGCSGLESMVLFFLFSVMYLWFARRSYRFPHALFLIPVGVAMMFVLNSGRITALVLIGNAGAAEFAVNGFHSQAGWLAFNLVALSFWFVLRQVRWFAAPGSCSFQTAERPVTRTENPASPYLVPLLVVLATTLASRAIINQPEVLYPLQVIAGTLALWCYRSHYSIRARMVWWPGIVAGFAAFVLWLALEPHTFAGVPPDGQSWVALSPLTRNVLLLFHMIGTVAITPIVEELAFRGFLARRIQGGNFEAVAYGSLSLPAILISSLLYGALNGEHLLAGFLAGAAYAILLRRTGRLTNAIVAHATTNALLAASVLVYNRWIACC